jgi:hypothetical protein
MADLPHSALLIGAAFLLVTVGCGRVNNPRDGKSAIEEQSTAKSAEQMVADSKVPNGLEHEEATGDSARGENSTAAPTQEQMHDAWSRGAAEVTMVEAKCRANDIAGAKARAAAIKHDMFKSKAFQRIGETQIKAGDKLGARESLMAAKAAAEMTRRDGEIFCRLFQDIAVAQAEAGDFVAAKATAARTGAGYAVWTNLGIAKAQAEAGDKLGARETLRRARAIVFEPHFEDGSEYPRSEYLSSIAAMQRTLGDNDEAKITETEIEKAKTAEAEIRRIRKEE